VLVADPRTDADVGAFFRQLPETEFLPTWHSRRDGGGLGPQEQAAARKAAVHANTPTIAHIDSLGRTVLTIAHNRYKHGDSPEAEAPIEEFYAARVMLDIEGNQREVADAKGRTVMRFSYDMLGGPVHQASMEAGERWTLNDLSGKAIRAWDSSGHTFRTEYDVLRRPIRRAVAGSDPARSDPRTLDRLVLSEKTEYGEGLPDAEALNLRGRVFRLCDGAGFVTNHGHDFKGNLLSSSRTLAQDYKGIPDWAGTPAVGDTYISSTSFDALNRPVTQTMPDSTVVRRSFSEAGLLESVDVNLRGEHAGGQRLWTPFVTQVDYDAKGQRVRVDYGNGAETLYRYDPETFRLMHLYSRRGASFSADCGGDPPPAFAAPEIPPTGQRCGLQNLHYTYDAAGNVTHIRDDAQQTIFFNGQVVEPHNDYRYDAIARLIEATGREHRGQLGQPQTSWNDAARLGLAHPQDGQAMRNYAEHYEYDAVGNVMRLVHRAEDGNWTRRHEYDEASLLETGQVNNRLSRSIVGDKVDTFAYDAHGNVVSMPHLAQMGWDFSDQLHQVDLGGGGTAYYVYDGAGHRVRKVIERQSGTRQKERIYLSGFELYREYDGAAATVVLARETVHVADNKRRIALVENRILDNEGSAERTVRFQLGNHLESASLELDEVGRLISYEEYHPYGTTSYQATRSGLEVASKRYRYTSTERDEESGFSYHDARYYAAWVGRWISADPAGLIDGSNLYRYARSNPIRFLDHGGMAPKSPEEIEVERLSDEKKFLGSKARVLEDDIVKNHVLAHDLEQTVKDNPIVKKDVKKYEEIKRGIRDAKASVNTLEEKLKDVRGHLQEVEKKLDVALDKLAGLRDPLSVKNDLDEFGDKLKQKPDLPDDVRRELNALEGKHKDLDVDEKKLLEEAEEELEKDLAKHADDAGKHADDADKLLKKGAKDVLERGSESGAKRVAKWIGRKLGSILPLGGAVASVLFAPDDQHPVETGVRAVASEIGVGPVDLELAMDFGEACAEGARRRAEWEFKETIRLEKKGWSISQIAGHVNRGPKY
jgi:RHS repeat-associated protein